MEPLADVDPVMVEREVVVESHVDRPIYIDRPVEVPVEKIVDREIIVEREVVVEKEIFVDRPVEVEKTVYVEKPVTVEIEKIVEKHVPVEVEKIVEKIVEKPMIVEKEIFVDKKNAAPVAAAAAVAAVGKKAKKAEKQPKAIIVGRGPSLTTKIGRFVPKPLPILAGAASLLAVIAILSLMSPSSDNASAERSKTRAVAGATAASPSLVLDDKDAKLKGKSRDPFAAKGYDAPAPTAATTTASKAAAKQATAAKAAAISAARTRAAAPVTTTTSLYTANLTVYTSFTPWKKMRKRTNGWVDFDNKPTIKVLSVGRNSIQLFAVTDVEVIKEKSSKIVYDKPIRQIKVARGGVVRFADYRNIQGDDVTYTIRYTSSDRIKVSKNAG
jgi:hypothetical protein